ncbi:MAG: hypothetical protein ACXAAO_02775 [Candidatus Thorarchaeota archaeon]|jgi:hypothetical protein
MRNVLSGLVAVAVGSTVITLMLGLSQPLYPEPFTIIWYLLLGSSTLQSTLTVLLDSNVVFTYLIAWVVIGLIIGPFSKAGWNTVRSVVWVGLIHAILALASLLLLNPLFWDVAINPVRNIDLFYQFATSFIVALFALPTALPTAMIINRLKKQIDPPIPTKIETVCECGAVFKSKPILCSECGTRLSD